MTVGDFQEMLEKFPADQAVTFGSSSFTRRPLIFYRFKNRGPGEIFLELTEISCNPRLNPEAYGNPEPEHERRITVGELLGQMQYLAAATKINFGCTTDCAPLKFLSLEPTVAINLIQDEPPLTREGA